MKIFLTLTLFIATQAFAQVYEHSKLQKHVGYSSLYEHPSIKRIQLDFLHYYADKNGPWQKEVNTYLRFGYWDGWVPDELDESILSVDSLLRSTPKLPKDVILFRGLNMSFMSRHYSIGEVFTDEAYFSTTSNLVTARNYSGYSSKSFVMVLYFEGDNKRGLVLNNRDKEVLLGRTHKYKVMDSAKGNTRRYGLVQICPADGCKDKISSKKISKWWKTFKSENLTDDSYNDISWGTIASELAERNPLPNPNT